MKDNIGAEILMGMVDLQKKADEAPWALKTHDLPKGKWRTGSSFRLFRRERQG